MTSIDTTPSAPYESPPRPLPTDGEQLQRVPPHSIEAETVVLGSMILDATCSDVLVEINQADHFYRPAHQLIFSAVSDLAGGGAPVDLVTLQGELVKRGQVDAIGGMDYAEDIVNGVPDWTNAAY